MEYKGYTITLLGNNVDRIDGKNTHVQGGDELFFLHSQKNIEHGKKFVDDVIKRHDLFHKHYQRFLQISGAVPTPDLMNEFAFLESAIRNDK